MAGIVMSVVAIPTLMLIEHRQSVSDELPDPESAEIGTAYSIVRPEFCTAEDMLEFELTDEAFGYPAGSRICLHIDQVNAIPVVMSDG